MQNFKIFQNHINTAINAYFQMCQDKEKRVSKRRRNDIANIKKIIAGNYLDYKKARKSVTYYINNMGTGWFFPTGKSDLKNAIESEMKKFKENDLHVLLTPTGKVPFVELSQETKPITIHIEESNESFKKNRVYKNEPLSSTNHLVFSFVK